MRLLKFIAIILILIGFTACEPAVTFTEPQPINVENLSKFPNRLQGQYLSLADNSTLIISNEIIKRIYDFDHKFHKNELDSTFKLSGDTITNLTTNETTIVKREGDSLRNHIYYCDTLFQMDFDNLVRKLKGYYFLNTRYDKSGWEVKKVHFEKGYLLISSISTKQDIESLKEIFGTSKDTIPPYNFTPTKKQFKDFIKNYGFSDNEIFVRER